MSAYRLVIIALLAGDRMTGFVGASFVVFTKKLNVDDQGPSICQSSAWARLQRGNTFLQESLLLR